MAQYQIFQFAMHRHLRNQRDAEPGGCQLERSVGTGGFVDDQRCALAVLEKEAFKVAAQPGSFFGGGKMK